MTRKGLSGRAQKSHKKLRTERCTSPAGSRLLQILRNGTAQRATRRGHHPPHHGRRSQIAHAVAAMAGWESEQAKKRQADAGKANLPGARESGSIDANSEKGRVDQILANKAGVGEATVRRAIAVREHGTDDVHFYARPRFPLPAGHEGRLTTGYTQPNCKPEVAIKVARGVVQ